MSYPELAVILKESFLHHVALEAAGIDNAGTLPNGYDDFEGNQTSSPEGSVQAVHDSGCFYRLLGRGLNFLSMLRNVGIEHKRPCRSFSLTWDVKSLMHEMEFKG